MPFNALVGASISYKETCAGALQLEEVGECYIPRKWARSAVKFCCEPRPPFVLELALGSASGEEEALVVLVTETPAVPEMTKKTNF